jgi:hypothetical protein
MRRPPSPWTSCSKTGRASVSWNRSTSTALPRCPTIVAAFRFEAVLAAVRAARGDVLIGAHLTLQLARHVLVIAMLLRDRDARTDHHRHGGSRSDQWAAQLAAAPAPDNRAGITAAIRFYSTALDEILAHWAPGTQPDNGPLLDLLACLSLVLPAVEGKHGALIATRQGLVPSHH